MTRIALTRETDLPFLGRSAELATVLAAVHTAGAGTGRVVLVEGEAGIGKSRLVAEALTEASSSGYTLVEGAGDEMERDRPFRAFSGALGLDPCSSDPDRAQLAHMLVDEEATPAPDLGFRIVDRMLALVEAVASRAPVVIVLEDLHWLDASSLRALRAIARAVAALPVAVLATLRPFPRGDDLLRVIDDLLARGATPIELARLSDADVATLATAVAGTPPGPGLLRQLDGAAGNPLFVIELVKAMGEEVPTDGSAPPVERAGGMLPATLRTTILRRIRFLPETAMQVLKVASVLGGQFPASQLAAVMGRRPAEILAALEDALDASLLEPRGAELAFRHEVIREAIYEDLAHPLRVGLHRQVAHVLRSLGAPLDQVAEHFFLGSSPGDVEAVAWLTRAARHAASRSPATGVKLFERALELVGRDGTGDDLVVELAPLLIQTGRSGEAERMTRLLLARGPQAVTEVALRRALGEALWTKGWLEPAVGELEAAASVAGAPEAQRLGSLALAANLKLFLGAPQEAERRAREALAGAERSADDFAACLARQTLAIAADARAEVGEAIGMASAAVAVAHRSGDPRVGHLHPHLSLGLVLFDADRLDEAEATLQEGLRRAEERGTVLWLPLYHCILAIRRLLIGEWDDALSECEAGLALAEEVETRLHVSLLHGIRAWVALQRGDLVSAQDRLEEASDEFLASASSTWQATAASEGMKPATARWPLEFGLWLQGLLHEARDEHAQSLSSLTDAWAVSAPLRHFLGCRLLAPDVVRVALRNGDRALATAVTRTMEEGARRSGTTGAACTSLRCRGLLDEDGEALAAAVERCRTTPRRVERAFALEEAGRALLRSGRAMGSGLLSEAQAIYQSMGATRATARCEAVLRALGVRTRRAPTARRRAVTGWESLTETELAVARLVAEGLTNRQIGLRLFISHRTVDTHLAHAFAKLGFTSRAQLAAEVARRS